MSDVHDVYFHATVHVPELTARVTPSGERIVLQLGNGDMALHLDPASARSLASKLDSAADAAESGTVVTS